MKLRSLMGFEALGPDQRAAEMLELLKDYPDLVEANVIDSEGKTPENLSLDLVLFSIFRTTAHSMPQAINYAVGDITKKLQILAVIVQPDSIEDLSADEIAVAKSICTQEIKKSFAYAKAVFQRAKQRQVKASLWGQSASKIAQEIEEKAPEELKKFAYPILKSWFETTINAKQDRVNEAMDGLARLMFVHQADDDDALARSLELFIMAAKAGYVPSMGTLADLLNAPDTQFSDQARFEAIMAIEKGAKKRQPGWQEVLTKLHSGNASADVQIPPEP